MFILLEAFWTDTLIAHKIYAVSIDFKNYMTANIEWRLKKKEALWLFEELRIGYSNWHENDILSFNNKFCLRLWIEKSEMTSAYCTLTCMQKRSQIQKNGWKLL
jgi:aspartyl/asparaginyl beta-hydroxylase (cupin superfamily)